MLGMGNNLLDDCLKFLDSLSGLENVPETVRHARQQFYDLLAVEIDCKEEMDVWVLCFGPELDESRENRSAVIHFINGGHGSLTPREKDLAMQDHKSMTKKLLSW